MSVDEYDRDIRNEKMIKVLSKINKKYGKACMISGSYALEKFLKDKSFVKFKKKIKKGIKEYYKDNNKDIPFYCAGYEWEDKNKDIDIFILGEKKKMIMKEIFSTIVEDFESPEIFEVKRSQKGLYNFYFKMNNEERRCLSCVWDNYLVYCTQKRSPIYQFILKDLHDNPSDVFAFFDLDCCKIGYFPGIREVVTCIGFIRSIFTRLNYLDLSPKKSGAKHKLRIDKYHHRCCINTTCIAEPLLSYYHDFRNINMSVVEESDIVEWCDYNHLGKERSSGEYYEDGVKVKFFYNIPGWGNPRGYGYYRNIDTKELTSGLLEIEHSIRKGKEQITSENRESYLVKSVGLVKLENGMYVYEDKKPRAS